jgi:hypothetical protein
MRLLLRVSSQQSESYGAQSQHRRAAISLKFVVNIFSLIAMSSAFCVQKAKTSKCENKQAGTCKPFL